MTLVHKLHARIILYPTCCSPLPSILLNETMPFHTQSSPHSLSAHNYDPTISLIFLMKLYLILSPSTPRSTNVASGLSWSSWESPAMPRGAPRAAAPCAAHRTGAPVHWGWRGFWPSPCRRKYWGLGKRQQNCPVLQSPSSLYILDSTWMPRTEVCDRAALWSYFPLIISKDPMVNRGTVEHCQRGGFFQLWLWRCSG